MNGAEVFFIGNLTKDPELRFSSSGNPWMQFTVAINEFSRSRDGEARENTTFMRCKAFGPMAENFAESIQKGTRVFVAGKIRNESWQDGNGQTQYATTLYADEVGVSLRWARANVAKQSSSGGSQPAAATSGQPAGGEEGNPFL